MTHLFHATTIANPAKAGRDPFVGCAGLDWQASYLAAKPVCGGSEETIQATPEVPFL